MNTRTRAADEPAIEYPEPLYKFYWEEQYARLLLRKGGMRWGTPDYYAGCSDASRRDPFEKDKSFKFAPAPELSGAPIPYMDTTNIPHLMFSMISNGSNIEGLRRKYGDFVVEIYDVLKFRDLVGGVLDRRWGKQPALRPVQYGVTIRPDQIDADHLMCSKTAADASDQEWRFVAAFDMDVMRRSQNTELKNMFDGLPRRQFLDVEVGSLEGVARMI